MKINEILLNPIISEKTNVMSDGDGKAKKYSFKVSKQATKSQIKQAIEKFYHVKVAAVNTLITAEKQKVKMTKRAIYRGVKPNYKKAIITLVKDNSIDLYNEIV